MHVNGKKPTPDALILELGFRLFGNDAHTPGFFDHGPRATWTWWSA